MNWWLHWLIDWTILNTWEFNCKHFVQNKNSRPFFFPMGIWEEGVILSQKGKKKTESKKNQRVKSNLNIQWAHYPYSTFTILANYKTINPLPLKIATAISLVHPFFTSILVIGCIIFCLTLQLNPPSRPQKIVPGFSCQQSCPHEQTYCSSLQLHFPAYHHSCHIF